MSTLRRVISYTVFGYGLVLASAAQASSLCGSMARLTRPFLVRKTLLVLTPPGRYGLSADPPIIRIHLINHDHRRSGILVEHLDQQIGNSLDKLGFLCWCGAIPGDLYIYERHEILLVFPRKET
jgi:hypothetical protein